VQIQIDFFEVEHAVEAPVAVNTRRKEMSDELRKQVYQSFAS
jgi:hypothetical protein